MNRSLKQCAARQRFLVVAWRGVTYLLLQTDRPILRCAGPSNSHVCLWSPRFDDVADRHQWIADTVVHGVGCFEAKGKTPQEALDALDRVLPAGPMVRGGTC
jgi:hypothetical protein